MDPRFGWKTVILVGAGFPVDQHTTEWLELMGVLNIGRLDQSICLRRSGSRLVSSPYGQPRSILEWCHSWRNLNQYQDDICFLFACLTWSRSYACTLSSSSCCESQPAVGKKSQKKTAFSFGALLPPALSRQMKPKGYSVSNTHPSQGTCPAFSRLFFSLTEHHTQL